jgi:hypothetical protein
MEYLTFDADKHIYRIGNRPVVSVTQVISGVFGKRFWYEDFYAGKGRAVHAAVSYYVNGELEDYDLDDRILGQIEAFKKFLFETGFNAIESEKHLYSKRYNFAGTPDLLLKSTVDMVLADIKASIEPIVNLQMAGYSLLYQEIKINPKRFCAIRLKPDGNYNLYWVKDIKNMQRMFLACLSVYNFKVSNKMIESEE